MKKLSLDIPYDNITALLEKDDFFRDAANKLSGYINELSHNQENLRVAIYGSNYSGKIVRDILSYINYIRIEYVFDINKRAYEPLNDIPHANLYDADNAYDLDLVIIGTSPNHYGEIEALIQKKMSCKHICTLYSEDSDNQFQEPIVQLSVNRRKGFSEHTKEYLPIIKERSALVMIDIWNTTPGFPCPFCDKIPRLIECFRDNNLLIMNAPTYSPDETPSTRIPITKILQRKRKWPPNNFFHRQGEFSHLDSRGDTEKPENDIHRPVCSCVGNLDRDNDVTVFDLDHALEILEDRGILYLFYVGGAVLQCLMHKPLGWLNLLKYGYLPIMVRDACIASDAILDGDVIDVKPAGIVHFESQCGFSTSVDDITHAF